MHTEIRLEGSCCAVQIPPTTRLPHKRLERVCRSFPPMGLRYSAVADDCCDSAQAAAGSIFPGNTNVLTIGQTACPALDPFDYDCSGTITDQSNNATTRTGCGNVCNASLWV